MKNSIRQDGGITDNRFFGWSGCFSIMLRAFTDNIVNFEIKLNIQKNIVYLMLFYIFNMVMSIMKQYLFETKECYWKVLRNELWKIGLSGLPF